jgi:hypothetical protein
MVRFGVRIVFWHAPYMTAIVAAVIVDVRIFTGVFEPLHVFRAAGGATRMGHLIGTTHRAPQLKIQQINK